ncbi:MAG: hypothetical protein HYZ27_07385 [Deltaproteobacteria bacterium]|nr:hypothetical protein [Deltaproteobacteria bacterium]
MSSHKLSGEEMAQAIVDAAKTLGSGLSTGDTDTLRRAHALLSEHFHQITAGQTADNVVEQRLIGTLWAEIEEIIDSRTQPKRPHRK